MLFSERLDQPAPPPGSAGLRIAVVVATLSRPEETGMLLTHLARQSYPASQIILSVESEADLPDYVAPECEIITGPRSLTAQRNRGMARALPHADVIVFFDDDFVPADDALAGIARLFGEHPEIAGATGEVLRDGVKLGGITYREARLSLAARRAGAPLRLDDTDAAYGCNMAFRASAVGELRFDEVLPLYGWQEDVDFTGQLLRRGRVVKTNAFSGVHLGVSKGRTPGLKLGYSQIVNPHYLVRKGTMGFRKASVLALKNMLANHAKLLRPEPFVDRAGRARGNWLGLWHVVTGRAHPGRALELR
jgi:GT2 family glycosyltransferase